MNMKFMLMLYTEFSGDQEKSSSGKKFESPKKSNFFSLKLFSSNFFLVHIELEVLQRWLVPNHKEWNNKVA